jgi:hypothetical protein
MSRSLFSDIFLLGTSCGWECPEAGKRISPRGRLGFFFMPPLHPPLTMPGGSFAAVASKRRHVLPPFNPLAGAFRLPCSHPVRRHRDARFLSRVSKSRSCRMGAAGLCFSQFVNQSVMLHAAHLHRQRIPNNLQLRCPQWASHPRPATLSLGRRRTSSRRGPFLCR